MVRDPDELAVRLILTFSALSHDLDTARFLQGSLSDVQAKYVICVFLIQIADSGQNLNGSMAANEGGSVESRNWTYLIPRKA